MKQLYGLIRLLDIGETEGQQIADEIVFYLRGTAGVSLLNAPTGEKSIIVYPLSGDKPPSIHVPAVRGDFMSFLREKYDASLISIFLASEVNDAKRLS